MLRTSPTAARAALLTILLVAMPVVAPAQPAPSTQSLIEQLRPRTGNTTRGIRLPAEESTAAPSPAAPGPAARSAPASEAATPPSRPARAAAVATTTAPVGSAAVSVTVNFPTGSAVLTPQALKTLAPLGQALASAELAPYRFRIEGHTDSVGDAEANLLLSHRRAAAVRDLLVNQYGVTAGRIEVRGLGETSLLAPTGDEVAEPRNRRVQVVNLDS